MAARAGTADPGRGRNFSSRRWECKHCLGKQQNELPQEQADCAFALRADSIMTPGVLHPAQATEDREHLSAVCPRAKPQEASHWGNEEMDTFCSPGASSRPPWEAERCLGAGDKVENSTLLTLVITSSFLVRGFWCCDAFSSTDTSGLRKTSKQLLSVAELLKLSLQHQP